MKFKFLVLSLFAIVSVSTSFLAAGPVEIGSVGIGGGLGVMDKSVSQINSNVDSVDANLLCNEEALLN